MNASALLGPLSLTSECENSIETWVGVGFAILFGISEAMGLSKHSECNGLVDWVKKVVSSRCLQQNVADN